MAALAGHRSIARWPPPRRFAAEVTRVPGAQTRVPAESNP